MMEDKNFNITISTGTVIKILAILVILAFAYFIRDIILIVFIAILFAAVIEPLVDFIQDGTAKIIKYNPPRGLVVIFIYLVLFLVLILAIRLIVPPIIEQIGLLTTNFPDLWEKIVSNFNSLKEYSQSRGLENNIQQALKGVQAGLESAAGGVYSLIISIFQSLVNFFLILIIIFYLVAEKDAFHKSIRVIAPEAYHPYLVDLFDRIQKKIGAWARGQLLLGLIIGVFTFFGLLFLLPKYALTLALLAGITEFIPYLGPILAAIPAIFLGFSIPPFSLWRGIAILILYLVIQQVEEKLIVPKVMQRQVGLNPVVIIIVMLIGFRVAGIIGLILAIPVTTTVGIIVKDFIQKSKLTKVKAELDAQKRQVD